MLVVWFIWMWYKFIVEEDVIKGVFVVFDFLDCDFGEWWGLGKKFVRFF